MASSTWKYIYRATRTAASYDWVTVNISETFHSAVNDSDIITSLSDYSRHSHLSPKYPIQLIPTRIRLDFVHQNES